MSQEPRRSTHHPPGKPLPRESLPRKPKRKTPADSFHVVIQCRSEQEQEALYEEFRGRNLTVRLLTM